MFRPLPYNLLIGEQLPFGNIREELPFGDPGGDPRSDPGLAMVIINRELGATPLKNKGVVFVSEGQKYNVNPFLLLGLAKAETNYSTDNSPGARANNPFNLGPGKSFANVNSAIAMAARSIASYKAETVTGVLAKWNPVSVDPVGNANGHRNVMAIMSKFGYGENDVHFSDVSISDPSGIIEEAAGAVADATGIGAIIDFLKWLTDPQHWLRIGLIVLGAAMLLGALYLAVKGFTT